MSINIDAALTNDVVVNWSGGPDSTGLIFLLLTNYSCNVYPIFINRCQTNKKFEEGAVDYYSKIFSKYDKFHSPMKVKIISPPDEFRSLSDKAKYALRNSDIINQGVRFAISKGINTVLLATFDNENEQLDGSKSYLDAKTTEVRVGTGNSDFIVCSPFHYESKFPSDKAVLFNVCRDAKFDLTMTRSCYGENEKHCGECTACTNRHMAFRQSGHDETDYLKKPNTAYDQHPEK
jgi:7-cyano-7-deazaguanine synthase in queuosine biosynthesis